MRKRQVEIRKKKLGDRPCSERRLARKDYSDRRRRQAQGQARAKAEGKYHDRPEDIARNEGIEGMLKSGMSWTAIQLAVGCSRATIAKVAKRKAA